VKATEQEVSYDTVSFSLPGGSTSESVDEILECDHESHCKVLSCGAVYYAVQGGSNF